MYTYGCNNTFTMEVTPSPVGSKPLPPGTVEFTDCDYSLVWVTPAEKTATCNPPVIPPSPVRLSCAFPSLFGQIFIGF
jgi:hypothetical protein